MSRKNKKKLDDWRKFIEATMHQNTAKLSQDELTMVIHNQDEFDAARSRLSNILGKGYLTDEQKIAEAFELAEAIDVWNDNKEAELSMISNDTEFDAAQVRSKELAQKTKPSQVELQEAGQLYREILSYRLKQENIEELRSVEEYEEALAQLSTLNKKHTLSEAEFNRLCRLEHQVLAWNCTHNE